MSRETKKGLKLLRWKNHCSNPLVTAPHPKPEQGAATGSNPVGGANTPNPQNSSCNFRLGSLRKGGDSLQRNACACRELLGVLQDLHSSLQLRYVFSQPAKPDNEQQKQDDTQDERNNPERLCNIQHNNQDNRCHLDQKKLRLPPPYFLRVLSQCARAWSTDAVGDLTPRSQTSD